MVRKTMHAYARCVVKDRHTRASDMILADEDNSTILKRYPDLLSENCMTSVAGSVQMTFGGDLYRYALADALVNADFALSGPGNFSDRLPLAHLPFPDEVKLNADLQRLKKKFDRDKRQTTFNKDFGVAWLSRYGECVVRKNPADARLWLLTPPDGAEELSRIKALQPSFAACLDGTQRFNRITMRGAVAINYYRLAMATPIAAARKKD